MKHKPITSVKYLKSESDYAKAFRCSRSSIQRYKRQGLPLDDEAKMREHLAGQKNSPQPKIGNDDSSEAGLPDEQVSTAEAKRRKTIAELRKITFQLEVEKKLYTENTQVVADAYTFGAAVGAALDKLRVDLPSILLGLDEAAMSQKIGEETDILRSMLADQMSSLYGVKP